MGGCSISKYFIVSLMFSASIEAIIFSQRDYSKLGIVVTAPDYQSERFILNNLSTSLESSKFYNKNLPTILFSYGYQDDLNDTILMQEAFQKRGGFNLLIVDWSDYNTNNYFMFVAPSVKTIAELYGEALFNLSTAYSTVFSSWRFVGHSLGAHMVGFIARQINKLSNGAILIPRLTGIDPAGPRFYDSLSYNLMRSCLQKTDGELMFHKKKK